MKKIISLLMLGSTLVAATSCVYDSGVLQLSDITIDYPTVITYDREKLPEADVREIQNDGQVAYLTTFRGYDTTCDTANPFTYTLSWRLISGAQATDWKLSELIDVFRNACKDEEALISQNLNCDEAVTTTLNNLMATNPKSASDITIVIKEGTGIPQKAPVKKYIYVDYGDACFCQEDSRGAFATCDAAKKACLEGHKHVSKD